LVCEAFEKCKENVAALSLENYLRGYMELYRFFGFLGSVFSFVASDVLSKITILEGYLNSEIGEHYMTIQAMITYENTNNLLRDPKRPSGARTLLRLHRALEFIAAFIGTISTLDSDGKTSTAAQECSNKTLAKFHPWLIQNAALLAMYTLPRKQQLLEKICDQQPPQDICVLMKQLQEVAVAVYDVTQNLYEEYNILDLP
ncbi:ceramide-1-phosphate transfer protein-like, partial [Limulus polyphemus]|uniref:Ceramide-1-phosphate transfer protein-like n=1 Tax=Limulus polyphemus TaxID=6850 RepID=A0ABM1BWS7_LIMPO